MNPRSGRGRVLNQANLSSIYYILAYLTIFIKFKASFLLYLYKGVSFSVFLINAPYFIQLKRGPFPIQEGPLDLPRYNLLFVDLIKLVYDKLRIYKDVPQKIGG